MNEIFLTLPSVPSLNHVYRNVRINLRIITPIGKAWKEEVKWIAISERLKQKWQISHSEKIVMELQIFWPDKRRRDADNCLKLLSDTLEGVLYEDDRWVLPRVLNWDVDKENPRVEVKLFKLNGIGGANV
jgi:crossover junction endodeoxyribonuclease RusA